MGLPRPTVAVGRLGTTGVAYIERGNFPPYVLDEEAQLFFFFFFFFIIVFFQSDFQNSQSYLSSTSARRDRVQSIKTS